MSVIVVTPAASHDLASLASVKAELGLTTGDDDAYLSTAIRQASGEVEGWTGRVFVVETVAETIPLDRPTCDLPLSRYPVQAVSSIAVDGVALDLTRVLVDNDSGLLRRRGASWKGTVVVTYTAGFPSIPASVERAVVALVAARWYARGRDPALKSATLPDVTAETYWTPPSDGGLPEDIAAGLSRFKVEVFG